jgi:hypothetical protein
LPPRAGVTDARVHRPSRIALRVIVGRFAICRFPATDALPAWIWSPASFVTITRSPTELSVVADQRLVPPATHAERDFALLEVVGPIDFQVIGLLAQLTRVLAQSAIPLFAVSTFDTDYILVRDSDLERGLSALRDAGCDIQR